MWIFGGFILKDYEEKEYEFLSNKSGIPASEIPNAFDAYEIIMVNPKLILLFIRFLRSYEEFCKSSS